MSNYFILDYIGYLLNFIKYRLIYSYMTNITLQVHSSTSLYSVIKSASYECVRFLGEIS